MAWYSSALQKSVKCTDACSKSMMSSPADVEPTLHLLNDVRYLYGQYLRFFSPVSATCEKLGYTLTSLRDGVRHFFVKYNTGDGPRAAFCQLTLGLCGTLITLKSGLSSCSRCFQSDSLATSDWPLALDSAWIEHNLEELSHISTMVEIINETMKLSVDLTSQRTCPLVNIY